MFLEILLKILSIFLLVGIGYFVYKIRLVPYDALTTLNAFVLNVAVPCMILQSMQRNEINDKIFNDIIWSLAAFAIVTIVIAVIATLIINRIKSIPERRKMAKSMMAVLDQRLSLGWNPLLEAKAPRANTRLFSAMDAFLKIKGKETEENSMRSYRSFIKTFKAWLTGQGFTENSFCCTITKEVALSFMDDVESDLSAKTFNNYITFYRTLFNWMDAKGYVDGNPFNDIAKKSRRLTKKKRRVLTDAELSRLWSYLQDANTEYLTMCLICYCCFIRPNQMITSRFLRTYRGAWSAYFRRYCTSSSSVPIARQMEISASREGLRFLPLMILPT